MVCLLVSILYVFHCFIFSVVTFTQERVKQLQQLSKQPDIYERLAKALGKHVLVVGIYREQYYYHCLHLQYHSKVS